MKVSIVAGGAGFIGVNIIPQLVKEGRKIVVMDNLCRGKSEYIDALDTSVRDKVFFTNVDLHNVEKTQLAFSFAQTMGDVDEVWHMAANSDIPAGVMDANVDLRDTFMTTFSILEAMKSHHINTLHFASSSAVYGDKGDTPIEETTGPLLPISNYGAMKLGAEGLISAAAESYLERVNIHRFPNVVGVPATHGVIFDFVNKLQDTPKVLDVLGDGTQQKSYLHVSDLVDAMFEIRGLQSNEKRQLFNIGPIDSGVTVSWIANQVVERVNNVAKVKFGQGNKGWVGDVPKFEYNTDKIQSINWTPKLDSEAAVLRAIDEIASQAGV